MDNNNNNNWDAEFSAMAYSESQAYLAELIAAYGAMQTEFTYDHIIKKSENPYPYMYPDPKLKTATVYLTSSADINQNLPYELAHELVHVLCTNGEFTANVLEEGLATYFAIEAVAKKDPTAKDFYLDSLSKYKDNKYYQAYLLHLDLIGIDPFAIRKLRIVCPQLGNLTHHDFKKAGLTIPEDTRNKLLGKMVY